MCIRDRLPDDEGSKLNACVDETFRFWRDGQSQKLTQLLFCDLSTPKTDGTFDAYNDVKNKLMAKEMCIRDRGRTAPIPKR